MLIIYIVCIEIMREVRPYAERIARLDPDLARQLKKCSVSVVLNVSEGSGTREGGGATRTRSCWAKRERRGRACT